MILRRRLPVGVLARFAHLKMTATFVFCEVLLQLTRALLRGAGGRQLQPKERALGWARNFFRAGEVIPPHFRYRGINARQKRVRRYPMIPATLPCRSKPRRP